jgi:tetratricopeptide (TPR) repeat protein
MKQWRVFVLCVACAASGALVQTAVAQRNRPAFSADLYQGKDPKAAATALLDGALQLAENGSWERIAVGRAWYLGGDKARGQQIFDAVSGGKEVEGSDWFRIGRVYAEAGEWDKAQAALDKALALDTDDDTGMVEYGALAMLNKDREKAEALFTKALTKKPREFWHWVNAGGSYLGVKAQ